MRNLLRLGDFTQAGLSFLNTDMLSFWSSKNFIYDNGIESYCQFYDFLIDFNIIYIDNMLMTP